MPEPDWGCYERLRPAQIDAIRHAAPIAYVPWGALEWHSYHNPVGLDGMMAHGLCKALARATGGVVLPPVYVGTDTIKPFKGFGHTLEHSSEVVRLLCSEMLEQLADEGFRVLVVLTGHCGGGHTDALQQVTDAFAAQHPELDVRMIPAFEPVKDVYPSNHAALGETSYQMRFDPDTVDLSRLPADRVATLDEDGVWGADPRAATPARAEEMLQLFLARTAPELNTLLNRHTP